MIRHAGLVAARIGGRWTGALIEGPSGSGKSDLALRAIGEGLVLVADDRTRVFVSRNQLFGAPPRPLAGLMEARGVGILARGALPLARIGLRVRCVDRPDAVTRLPDPAVEPLLGVPVPVIDLWPFEASAPLKLILALRHLGVSPQEAYQARFAPPQGGGGRRGLPVGLKT